MLLPISIFLFCFSVIMYHNRNLGILFFFFLLPTYLIRLDIFGIPTTLLELVFIITTTTLIFHPKNGLLHKKKYIFTPRYLWDFFKKHQSLSLATGLFLFSHTIGIGIATNTSQALGAWKAFFFEPILLAFLLTHIIEKKRDISAILFGLTLSGLATALLATYQHFTGWMVPWDFWENRNTYRVTGWYGFPNGVGIYLAPITAFAAYLITTTIPITKKTVLDHATLLVSIIYVPLSIMSIIYAKSTGALIAVIGATVLWLLLQKKTRNLTCVCILVGITIFVSLPAENAIKQEVLAQDRSGKIRQDMWAESIEYLRAHPLTGAGLMSYQKEIWPYRIDKWIEVFHHPHNTILTMWMNGGFFGMFGFVWLCVWLVRSALRDALIEHNTINTYVLCALATFLIMGLVDSPYIKNDMAIIFWLLPVLTLHSSNKKSTPLCRL